jgi:hypothetical protein
MIPPAASDFTKELGAAQYGPGERETIQAILVEADEQARAVVRQQMGLS